MSSRTGSARGGGAVARAWLLVATAMLLLGVIAPAHGCDLCAIYTTSEAREEQVGLLLGLAS